MVVSAPRCGGAWFRKCRNNKTRCPEKLLKCFNHKHWDVRDRMGNKVRLLFIGFEILQAQISWPLGICELR